MASKRSLLDLDDDDNDLKLEINRDYAQKYSTWRQKEELQRLKTKYGEEVGASSSSSEEEDEDAKALTETVDKSWFRALAAVRSNDPRIYEKDVKFFDSDGLEEEDDSDSTTDTSDSGKESPKKKKKDDGPMYMKDFERKLITEKGGILSESDDDDDEKEEKLHGPSYHEEQEAIKKSLKTVIADMSSDDEDEEILQKRIKTKKEKAEEEEEYIQFLKGLKGKEDLHKDKDIAEDLAPLKELYSRPDLDEDDKLLWNIVLDQGFRVKNKAEDEDWYAEQMAQLQVDEEAIEEQEEFEHKYNFRFEEPDKDFVKTYERNPQESLRQKVNKRALKRQEIKERKKMEKDRKQEEIRQLKNLKKKEILAKLDQLKEVTGNPTVGFSAKDIEEEFDPAAHDKMMQKYFGEEFYKEEELEKPQFEDDDELDEDEDWDAWEGPSGSQQEGDEEEHAGYSGAGPSHDAEADIDDPDFNMDADYDPSQASYTSGKKKKKSKFKQLIEKRKPTFEEVCKKYEGSDHPFGDYLDEYFKLDCEDIIGGDIKCRFRYRKTVPNDYGLTVEEILRCPDKELNAWASMKKIAQFRNADDELYEVRKYKKAKTRRKKLNILPSLKEPSDVTEPDVTEEQQRKQVNEERGDEEENNNSFEQSDTEQSPKKNKHTNSVPLADVEQSHKKKKKKRRAVSLDEDESADSAAPCKKRKKVKHANESELLNYSVTEDSKHNVRKEGQKSELKSKQLSLTTKDGNSEVKQKKKKKKKKLKEGESEATPADRGKKKREGKKGRRKMDSKPKKKGYQAGDMISSSRLLALGVDPRKFKYTKHRIMQEPGDD